MNAQDLQNFYVKELRWCDCAEPDGAMRFMGEVLDVMKRRRDENAWEAQTAALQAMLGDQDSMLGLSYLYLLHAAGLTEHGGNVWGSWLSSKGEEVLAAIKAHGDEVG